MMDEAIQRCASELVAALWDIESAWLIGVPMERAA
jgi:hypothetical protein